MDFYNQPQSTVTAARGVEVDQGLRSYMLRIYNYMASALVLTGLVAFAAGSSPAFLNAMITVNDAGRGSFSLFGWLVTFAPLGIVIYLSSQIWKISENAAKAWFWAYSVAIGLSFSFLMMAYTGESIARAFLITATTFGGVSLYGYTTKKDLSGWGSFLMMGVIGLLVAGIVNIFLGSGPLQFAISAATVLIFAGLTAYETQSLKGIYYRLNGSAMLGRAAIMGALNLYISFINLFLAVLRLTGSRR